jgi:catechol 2,3-dioxygenase-like lactoylglutathione lyase family enzyme
MDVLLDHTIVNVIDRAETIGFYTEVLGFEYAGSTGTFEVIRINDDLSFDLVAEPVPESRHFAFAMERSRFDDVFTSLREGGFAYGDGPSALDNMRGPGRSTGTHGVTHSVYFRDPSGHALEIITYD